jgi:type IV pilus biogenesis protein CpaD/CtpE
MTMRTMILLTCAALAGCAQIDPFQREGMWRPSGANEANLRAMVVDPGHLTVGVGTDRTDGQAAAGAVDRLRRDRVKPLPDTAIARIGAGGGAAAAVP